MIYYEIFLLFIFFYLNLDLMLLLYKHIFSIMYMLVVILENFILLKVGYLLNNLMIFYIVIRYLLLFHY
jgi:hypothetical protein